MYAVYIIYSEKFNKHYVGFTSNLEGRLIAHNHKSNKGWTKRYQPWNLLYNETYETRMEAQKREKELKSYRGRLFIKGIIGKK